MIGVAETFLLIAVAQVDTPRPNLTPEGWGPVKIGMTRAQVEAAMGTKLEGEPIEDEYSCIEMAPASANESRCACPRVTWASAPER